MLLYRAVALLLVVHISTCQRWPSLSHIPLDMVPPPSQLKKHFQNVKDNYEDVWNVDSETVFSNRSFYTKKFPSFEEYKNAAKTKYLNSAPKTSIISEKCHRSIERWITEDERKLYARRMWDSWGSQETGILEGNVRYLGHYHECKLAKNEEFGGKWCVAYYGFLLIPHPASIPIDITLGNCFPSTCSNEEIRAVYNESFRVPGYPPLLDVQCSREPTWETVDTICAVIIGVMTLLCTFGTIVDLFLRFTSKPTKDEPVFGTPKNKESILANLALPFSIISNGEKIIDMKRRPGTLPILDGLRFISTTWVVLGHTLQMMFYGLDNTLFGRRAMLNNPSTMVLLNAFFSVDSFFFLSGLLVAYLGMKHIVKQKGRLNVCLMYLQRYLRLTPLYAFLILFHMSIYKYFGSGPFWLSFSENNYETCKDNWWTNLLYINNLYPVTNYCYSVAWYLANDMQFYLLAPIFLFLLYRFRIVGILATISVIVGSTVVNGVLTSVYELQPTAISLVSSLSYFYRWYIWLIILFYDGGYSYETKFTTDIYTTPWARIHVYMIGMLVGYILYVNKGKVKMNKVVALIGWTVSAGVALALIYSPWPYVQDMKNMEIEVAAAYNALGRPVWAFCLAWVVIACSSGYGGPITTFLNWKVFTPLSRLTYSTYLFHIYVLYWYAFNQDEALHFLMPNFVYIYLASLILSFGCGFILSVTIEWPFMGLCKLLFNPFPLKVQPNKVTEDTSVEETVSETSHSDSEKWEDALKVQEQPHAKSTNYDFAYENKLFHQKSDEASTVL